MKAFERPDAQPTDLVGSGFYRLTFAMAVLGGLLMVAISLMVMISVVGRAFFNAPIYGDFELVAMGTAMAVVMFFPYCHQKKGNVIVDLFLSHAPEKVKTATDVAASLLYGAIAGMITWRSFLGGVEMYHSHETSMILSIPTWWAFPFLVVSFAVLTVSCLLTLLADLGRLVR